MSGRKEDPYEVYAGRLLRGSAVVFSFTVASTFVAFLLRMFLARSLSVGEYGLFYALLSFVSFFALFRDQGLSSALVKFIPEFGVKGKRGVIRSALLQTAAVQGFLSLFLVLLLFLLSPSISSSFFGTGEALSPFRILLLWFFLSTFYNLLRLSFQGFQDMLAYSLSDVLWICSVSLLAVLMVGRLGLGVEGVCLAYSPSAALLTVFGLFYLSRRYLGEVGASGGEKGLLGRLFSFALPAMVGGLGVLVLAYTDTLMLTLFRGVEEVGLYQAAQPLAALLGYLVGALTATLFPLISEMWAEGKRREVAVTSGSLFKLSLAATLPFFLFLFSFPEVAVRLVFGEGYVKGVWALRILSLNAVAYTLMCVAATVMMGAGKPMLVTKAVGAMAGLNFFANLLLIPPFGVEGASLATLLSTLLGVLLLAGYGRRFLRMEFPQVPLLKTVVGGILSLLLMVFLKSLLTLSPWPEALVVVSFVMLFYSAWILRVGVLDAGERGLLSSLLLPRRFRKG